MKYWNVALTPEASHDLEDIYSYIRFSLHEPDIAKKLVRTIKTELKSLAQLPNRCAPVQFEPWNERGLRKLLIGNYIAIYMTLPGEQVVSVIRIVYGGQDIEQILGDLQNLP